MLTKRNRFPGSMRNSPATAHPREMQSWVFWPQAQAPWPSPCPCCGLLECHIFSPAWCHPLPDGQHLQGPRSLPFYGNWLSWIALMKNFTWNCDEWRGFSYCLLQSYLPSAKESKRNGPSRGGVTAHRALSRESLALLTVHISPGRWTGWGGWLLPPWRTLNLVISPHFHGSGQV